MVFKMNTSLPTLVLPVKEIRGNWGSFAIALPTSAPPQIMLQMAPGRLLSSKTLATILLVAMLQSGVDGAPFQIIVLPQIYFWKWIKLRFNIDEHKFIWITMARALFQPKTATGKLKAEMMPTVPRGFHISSRAWLGLSDGITLPSNILESPTA